MVPLPADWAAYMALIGGGFLLLLGLVFVFAPKRGLAMTDHRADNLPTIMAGRYFFMAIIAVAVGLSGSAQQIAFVFMGLAGVAFFDAATYAHAKAKVAPHIGAGVLALLVSLIALEGKAA
ncbi:MAG: hypothetical protein QNI84_08435 [Henriciella sp.]|nr:hypothetical protein [Henriciella sp.]